MSITPDEILALFPACSDLSERTLPSPAGKLTILYFENICDRRFIHDYILMPLITATHPDTPPENLITCGAITLQSEASSIGTALLNGEAIVFCPNRILSVKVQSELARSVSEPETETVIRGPREGFTERAGNNAALLRRRIRSPHLKLETLTLGRTSNTLTLLMYMEDRVNREALEMLRQRLAAIDADAILDSGQLELWLEQSSLVLFPGIGNSERPDKVAAKLLEGRIALLVDGTPVVLTLPYLFIEALQSTEDYGKSLPFAFFVRCLRLLALLLSLYLPAVFLALLLYHPEALPPTLLEKILQTREQVPFSPFLELLLVLFAFELIREVAIRMPRSVGSAVGLVAALILGDSAISAGITSAPMIIVVAITAIGTFLVPPYMNSVILLRLLLLLLSRLCGLFGIAMLSAFLLLALCAKSSFGVPYLSPITPLSPSGLLDFLIVAPPWGMKLLPPALTNTVRKRNTFRKGGRS